VKRTDIVPAFLTVGGNLAGKRNDRDRHARADPEKERLLGLPRVQLGLNPGDCEGVSERTHGIYAFRNLPNLWSRAEVLSDSRVRV
jgi:arginine utilization protein RocB